MTVDALSPLLEGRDIAELQITKSKFIDRSVWASSSYHSRQAIIFCIPCMSSKAHASMIFQVAIYNHYFSTATFVTAMLC